VQLATKQSIPRKSRQESLQTQAAKPEPGNFGSGEGAVPLSVGGAVSPSNTTCLGPRPTCVPSFVLIHPTVWPQYTNVRQDNVLIV